MAEQKNEDRIRDALKWIDGRKKNAHHAIPLRVITPKVAPPLIAHLLDHEYIELGQFDHCWVGADFEKPTERDKDGKVIASQRINTRKLEVGTTMSFTTGRRNSRKSIVDIIAEDNALDDERLFFHIRLTDKGLAASEGLAEAAAI